MDDIEIEIDEIHRTDEAVLVDNGDVQAWIPISLISDYIDNDQGEMTAIFISDYLAAEKGLI